MGKVFRSWRAFAGGAGLVAAGLAALIGVRAARAEIDADFRPPRPHLTLPVRGSFTAAESVQFRSARGDDLRGWWLPPQNGSSVVFVHGTGTDRSQLLPQAEVLAKSGYGVLLFDLPGHGQSTGRVTWSHTEPSALASALSYVRGRGTEHLGVVGFSAGAMIALHLAMQDRRVEALAVEGAFDTLDGTVLEEFRHWGPLSQWPALLAARWAGFREDELGPLSPLRCPTLFIAGGHDQAVPMPLTLSLFARIQGPKELWVIDNATHGTYQQAAGREFDARLLAFFDKAFQAATVAAKP